MFLRDHHELRFNQRRRGDTQFSRTSRFVVKAAHEYVKVQRKPSIDSEDIFVEPVLSNTLDQPLKRENPFTKKLKHKPSQPKNDNKVQQDSNIPTKRSLDLLESDGPCRPLSQPRLLSPTSETHEKGILDDSSYTHSFSEIDSTVIYPDHTVQQKETFTLHKDTSENNNSTLEIDEEDHSDLKTKDVSISESTEKENFREPLESSSGYIMERMDVIQHNAKKEQNENDLMDVDYENTITTAQGLNQKDSQQAEEKNKNASIQFDEDDGKDTEALESKVVELGSYKKTEQEEQSNENLASEEWGRELPADQLHLQDYQNSTSEELTNQMAVDDLIHIDQPQLEKDQSSISEKMNDIQSPKKAQIELIQEPVDQKSDTLSDTDLPQLGDGGLTTIDDTQSQNEEGPDKKDNILPIDHQDSNNDYLVASTVDPAFDGKVQDNSAGPQAEDYGDNYGYDGVEPAYDDEVAEDQIDFGSTRHSAQSEGEKELENIINEIKSGIRSKKRTQAAKIRDIQFEVFNSLVVKIIKEERQKSSNEFTKRVISDFYDRLSNTLNYQQVLFAEYQSINTSKAKLKKIATGYTMELLEIQKKRHQVQRQIEEQKEIHKKIEGKTNVLSNLDDFFNGINSLSIE
ncbi:hypothetical protein BY458DRAFT_27755 [Sporodiniella umbellata]|nr:hypothetical protein BY458DRAFT_27755 [Sporodiniella umbellata]